MDEDSKNSGESEICALHKANGLEAWCSRDECVFWRFIEAQEATVASRIGCGLQFHERIEGLSGREAEWMLMMKRRLENSSPGEGRARILFRRRESEK